MSPPQKTEQLILQGTSYDRFIDGIPSPASKKSYRRSLRRYLNYLKLKEVDDLLIHEQSPRIIEDQIIGYIKSLRNDDVSYSTIKFLISPIFTYYQLNHVVLSRKTVSRYMGEFKRRVKDEAYTNENILQMLQNTDRRMRMCTLIMASTGCRIGALPDLTLGSLTKIPDYGGVIIVIITNTLKGRL